MLRLPAEWEPQSGVMLTWPHEYTDWKDDLDRVLPVFAGIGAAVSQYEKLLSVCRDEAHQARIAALLERAGAKTRNLRYATAPGNDTWARDHGPITVLADTLAVLNDYRFDGWGGKFDAELDNAITGELAKLGVFGSAAVKNQGWILEGGAIETDGNGTLMATRASVLDHRRNPGVEQSDIESHLRDALGIQRFLWLDHGHISGDDTDSHIDTLARFTNPDTIVYTTAPAGDRDHAALQAMADQLASFDTPDGDGYRLVPLPFPGIHMDGERRLPATYANFLIINQAVLLPVYGVPQDDEAIEVLADCLPGRTIVPIDCREIIPQNGSLHCLTMQFPAAVTLHDGRELIDA